MPKPKEKQTDPMLSELTVIKKLMILALVRDGMQQSQIASATGMDNAALSRAFPKGLAKVA